MGREGNIRKGRGGNGKGEGEGREGEMGDGGGRVGPQAKACPLQNYFPGAGADINVFNVVLSLPTPESR